MKPLEYLKFCEDDIYLNLIVGNFYSPEKAKEIIQTLVSFIERLSEVRHSEEKTELILKEIDKFPDNEMRSIKHWLVKSLADDDSFVYAFNPLAYNSNKQTIVVCYQVKYISKLELYDLLKAEENQVNPPQRFIIKSDDEMKKIYTICQDDAFECKYSTFRNVIETANFQELTIKRQNITQELVYRLSDKMGGDWYTKVCESKKWEKSDCSKQYDKVKDDVLIKQLDRILPRTIKRNRTK